MHLDGFSDQYFECLLKPRRFPRSSNPSAPASDPTEDMKGGDKHNEMFVIAEPAAPVMTDDNGGLEKGGMAASKADIPAAQLDGPVAPEVRQLGGGGNTVTGWYIQGRGLCRGQYGPNNPLWVFFSLCRLSSPLWSLNRWLCLQSPSWEAWAGIYRCLSCWYSSEQEQ